MRCCRKVDAVRLARPVHPMQRVELEVVALIEPRAADVVEPETGAAGQRQGLHHQLLDGLHVRGVGLVVEDVHLAVPDQTPSSVSPGQNLCRRNYASWFSVNAPWLRK